MLRVLLASLGWTSLKYVVLLTFEERPKTITLECVENLSNNRTVQGHREKGTIIVIEALRERGYVGQWRKGFSNTLFLPQSRPRVWALFLKVSKSLGPKAIREHERELDQAFNFHF